ncbi:MAG TPA: hypothetical protein VKU84_14485 [Stellaceae bacterium]|nr:hypothetical protein [Stellaceae bacterium]
MRVLIISAVVALAIIGVAEAQDARTVQCQKNADVRTVTVESSAGGCRVLYAKGNSPGRELWQYKTHPDMCQTPAQQFVAKLESMGLTCTNKQ